MLGVDCAPSDAPAAQGAAESFSVLIGLAGAISGSCMLRADKTSSHHIASLLTGAEGSSEDTVKDALGEVCNMVAGTWKRGVPELASLCMLSPPTVISGTDYSLHSMPGELRMQRYYSIGNSSFAVLLQCTDRQ
jgi:chemotaxis protein CheX